MLIRLEIDNVDRLANGGPIIFSARDRSFEIGRDSADWTLPDPDRFISGRHCEIRFEGGGFWLNDVSRNGTLVNGRRPPAKSPQRLGDGDRLQIGRYLISVAIDGNGQARAAGPPSVAAPVQRAPSRGGAAAAGPEPALGARDLLGVIAKGAGVSPTLFDERNPEEAAAEIGHVLRLIVTELALLLRARAAAKVLAGNADRTMIGHAANNPLKLVPDPGEAFDILFGRPRAGYLKAEESFTEAFHDLKTHEFATYAAMQAALARLLEEFSPDAIENKIPSSFMSKKGRAWDVFVATWEARENAHENGMLDVFLAYFSDAYAKAAKGK